MSKKTPIFQIFLILFATASLLSAQTVTQIKFEGLSHLSSATAKEIAGIHVGDEINSAKVNESIKNFFSQGYFTDVWVDQQGSVLVYHFKEKLAIANIEIQGYGSGDEGEKLLQETGMRKGDLYDERRLKNAKQALLSKLESQGYYNSVVETTTTPVGEGGVSLVFDVNKGEKIIIEKQNFVGADALVQSDLELDLANKEKDFLGWMPWRNNGEASVEQLEYDAYRVKDMYMRKGYLDAYVSKPLMRTDFGSYKAEVDYQIVEGIQYRVGTVGITQDVKGLKTEDLKELLTMNEGKIFNIKRMRKDMDILKEEVGNLGYAFVNIAPQMHKDPAKKIVNLQYVVQPGEKVTINDVIISGNDSTKDRVIRRYVYLAPGDQFSAKDLKDSKNALGRTGFFENVDVESQRVSADKINLLVNVKETATGTISVGGGYGSYQGFMLSTSVSDRNIFGSGINASLGFDYSKISKSYNLSFINPKIWDSMYSLGVNLYKSKFQYDQNTIYGYNEDRTGASVTLGREFYRYFNASIGIGYLDNQTVLDDSITYNPYAYFFNAQYTKTSLFTGLGFDNTDDYYVPREGMLAALNIEIASVDGIDSQNVSYDDFVKFTGKFGTYYGLEDWIDYDMILRLKARGTAISSSGYVPLSEKLRMGGIGSVRGYQSYSIIPLENNSQPWNLDTNQIVGGKYMASTSVEASIPLSEAAKMRLAFFYDYGMIGNESINEMTRSSTGVVLEWQSGFGPINLVFATPLDSQTGDQTAAFEFSMGTNF
ncbi:MAG: outer membrane protein assembly factor BamA [Pseudomonadota bacterium]